MMALADVLDISEQKGMKAQHTTRRLSLLRLARFQGRLFAVLGLACGGVYAFGGLAIDILVTLGWMNAASVHTPGLSIGTLLAFGAIVGMPLIGGVFGVLTGVVGAFLYNTSVRYIPGLQTGWDMWHQERLPDNQ